MSWFELSTPAYRLTQRLFETDSIVDDSRMLQVCRIKISKSTSDISANKAGTDSL